MSSNDTTKWDPYLSQIIAIRVAFSKLNKEEDWVKRREDVLRHNDLSSCALLILQKIVMNCINDPNDLQVALVRQAFQQWESAALSVETYLWENVVSMSGENGRCRALLELRSAITG